MQEVGDLIFRVSLSPQDVGTQGKLVTHTEVVFGLDCHLILIYFVSLSVTLASE